MNDFKERLVHLHHCRGANWNVIFSILKRDPELHSLYKNNFNDHISSSSIHTFQYDLHSLPILEKIHEYEKDDIHTITLFDHDYPTLLRETYKPPWVIYTKGDQTLLTKKKLLAVVGSRQATLNGKNTIKLLFPKLIQEDVVIVSGLAMGIDACAHQTAIEFGGKTIGVIAGGFQHLYPRENEKLANEMMEHHLVLSEYPPETRPQKWHFPMRNRIIAGLCHGTLIVEAKKKSGSLITANYAVQEGREVFAVPGNVLGSYSAGTNELIQQGAKLVISAQDILEELI